MHTTKKNRDNHSEISLHQQDNSVLKSNKSGTFAMLAKAFLCPGEFDNDKFWKHIYREQKTYQQGLVSSIRNKEGNLDFIYGKDPLLCFIGKYNEDADVYACWPELKSVLTSLGECFKDKEHLKEIVADCLKESELNKLKFRKYLDTLLPNDMSPEDPNTPPPSGPNTPPPSGPNNSGLTGILGADIQSKQSCYALMFKIMGGILAVAGACCILLASLALGGKLAVAAGIVGGVGLLSGIGLFKAATKLPDTVVQQASPTLS